jgi:GNAT superfamily N-acetyltransferase
MTKADRPVCRVMIALGEVEKYLPDVIAAADSDKNALGFFPETVYRDFARKDLLLVAVINNADGDVYAGHLIFNAKPPTAHVRQVFVAGAYRKLGVGKVLLETLKAHLTQLQFISIHARVAEDLQAANIFWQKHGFYPQRVVPGGATKKRMIIVRAHELATPQLFSRSNISAADPLGLLVTDQDAKPIYLLDLNVLFDLNIRRPRNNIAVGLFRAERVQACSLAISSEISEELKRTAHEPKTDPMLGLAKTLPSFVLPETSSIASLTEELGAIVFRQRSQEARLTANDLSDLRHLATAVYYRLPGLITNDASILGSANDLLRLYRIEVVSPEAFQTERNDHHVHDAHATRAEQVLNVETPRSEDEPNIGRLLTRLGVNSGDQISKWAAVDGNNAVCSRSQIRHNLDTVGYVVWPHNPGALTINALIAVDESSSVAADAARLLLNQLHDAITNGDIVKVRISTPPRQVVVRDIAVTLGYAQSSDRPGELQKIVVKKLIQSRDWPSAAVDVSDRCGVYLPQEAPAFRNIDQQVALRRPDGEQIHVSLFSLETLLSPALFCLGGRPGVLVPIARRFAEHLLQHATQGSLLPRARAQIFQQRHYISGPLTAKVFRRGDLMFFYESGKDGGASAVVAIARVLRTYKQAVIDFDVNDLSPSILTEELLKEIGASKTKTVTVFDNLITLSSPVDLSVLKRIGIGQPHQLITSRRLTLEKVRAILESSLNG